MEMKIELKAAEREVELRKNQLNNVLHEVQLKQLATSFFFLLTMQCAKHESATVEDFHHNRTRMDGGSRNIENTNMRGWLTMITS